MSGYQIALIGNPNTGKSTLFNALTNSNQRVGNWPGVTIEKKTGKFYINEQWVELIDLPGVYGLSAISKEEEIVRDFLLNHPVDLLYNIVDGNNLERNLYLTLLLKELHIPMITLINMSDELSENGVKIDYNKLSQQMGTTVLPISSAKKKGLEELRNLTQNVMAIQIRRDFHSVSEPTKQLMRLSPCDEEEEMMLIQGIYERIERISELCLSREKTDVKNAQQALDAVFTNRWIGLPFFAFMMYLVFWLTFSVGGIFQEAIDSFFSETVAETARQLFDKFGVVQWLSSLIVDGVITGVGSVLTFLPNIILLFLAIAFLEDSGYMARVAYVMDRLMRQFGLNGKAIVPMIMGFGCNCPAIMGTRIIDQEDDRLIAILINPFISCGARLPIYVLMASIFFPENASSVTFSLYVLGMFIAIASARLFKRYLIKGGHAPFVLELPPYRMPTLKGLALKVAHHAKAYLFRAGTVIFLASVGIWLLLNFGIEGYGDIRHSFGNQIGHWIAPIFTPMGFGNWQSSLSLLAGIVAKEIVIANMSIIYQFEGATLKSGLLSNFSSVSAYAFMVFSLLYVPCIAVIGMIRSETQSWKWTIFSITYNFSVAWLVATLVYQIGIRLF